MSRSGAWASLDKVVQRLEAKHSKVLSAADLHYNAVQWTDRMTARNASPKEAQKCWEDSCDMAGNKYEKVEWKGKQYIVASAPISLAEEKRLDNVKKSDSTVVRPSRASLLQDFASEDLGFEVRGDGSHQLRRSNAFDFESWNGADVDDERYRTPLRALVGNSMYVDEDKGGFSLGGDSVPRPSLSRARSSGGENEENVRSGGSRRAVGDVVRPSASRRSVQNGYTEAPKKLKTLPELKKEIDVRRGKPPLERDCEIWNAGYYMREYILLRIKKEWNVVYYYYYYYYYYLVF